MKTINLVSGNMRKLGEAKSSCDLFNIAIRQRALSIPEIQSHDPIDIARNKAEAAYELLSVPLVVNDAFFRIPALNGFPGGYMKDVADWFKPTDFIALLADKTDRRIIITECVVYQDADIAKVFTKDYEGLIGTEARGVGNSIEQVAIFEGLTLAEHHDIGQYSQKPEDQIWHDFAQWYINYESKPSDS